MKKIIASSADYQRSNNDVLPGGKDFFLLKYDTMNKLFDFKIDSLPRRGYLFVEKTRKNSLCPFGATPL